MSNQIAITFLSILAMISLSIMVYENDRIKEKDKLRFYSTYLVIAIAALSELSAILLDGAPSWTIFLHKVTKCLDYICTPAAALMFLRQVLKDSKVEALFKFVLLFNIVLQAISLWTGWTYYVDDANYYHHGPFYMVYVLVYMIAFVIFIYGFMVYGKQFRRSNQASLISIILTVIVGTFLQETLSDVRVVYVGLTFGSILMFVHYNEFAMIRQDDLSSLQEQMLETDSMTQLYSRFAYSKTLDGLSSLESLPKNLVAVSLDVNSLKAVNDSLGHSAGDELIIGAAQCIDKIFSGKGKCYRTGGDEFEAFVYCSLSEIKAIIKEFKHVISQWDGVILHEMSVSVGYACASEHPECNIEELIKIADKMMYQDKHYYYVSTGKDRRTR